MLRESHKTLQIGPMIMNSIPEEGEEEKSYDEQGSLFEELDILSCDKTNRTINARTDLRYYQEVKILTEEDSCDQTIQLASDPFDQQSYQEGINFIESNEILLGRP